MGEVTGLSKVAQDADFLRQVPFKQYETVSVSFPDKDLDVAVSYNRLTPTDPNAVRFLDIGDKSVYDPSTGAATPAHLYRTPVPWDAQGQLFLRSSEASYSTTVLLFVERA